MTHASLPAEIAQWDGKATDVIQEVYDTHGGGVGFQSALLSLLAEGDLQVGVTWLIKRALEDGVRLSARETGRLIRSGKSLERWEAVLHYLQILPMLKIPTRQAESLFIFCSALTVHKRPFIRAWAYNGVAVVGEQHVRFSEESARLLSDALADEAASVRARIRIVLAAMGK